MTPEELAGIDELSGEDRQVRNLARIIRDGLGVSLESAVEEACEMGIDRDKVEAAAERIRELQESIQDAQKPRAVVAGNIESWYFGPRQEDRSWPALRALLIADGWEEDGQALEDLDESSTKVVANLPNPHGAESYQCRGLVLGYVQSGKTTNFTAVIAKAADAGYRLFIVLSGIHNALRWQTQDRLNEQLWELNRDSWHRLTDEEDFRATSNVDALLAARQQHVLAIVKKNGPRLRALKRWLFEARPGLLEKCPVLIIDDEADQATVNTAKPDRKPSTINGLIREIVNGLPKSAYVGYTATPFANVLIDPQNYEDLYPRDFIVDLPRPEVYIGPEAIFGREPLEFDADDVEDDGHDFVRTVPAEELQDLKPRGASTRHDFEPDVTESLDQALRYFLLSTAARRVRGVGNPHATALVHTSQHIDVHDRTAEAVRSHLRSLASRLLRRDDLLVGALEDQWRSECDRVPASDFGVTEVPWDDVVAVLPSVAEDAEVITDNSRSAERLTFDKDNPRVIVAVGGNTLSRGLTLEGLSVSFFIRTASAYDTLLQMGRWFGYRNGYADLTRIWMPDDMREWFHHLATVEQEIRYEIERYETGPTTPEQMGVRIGLHPKLAVTSAAKMQGAVAANASYSGQRIQTILFNHRDGEWLEDNREAVVRLVAASADATRVQPRPGITLLGPVPSALIVDFVRDYRFHENSRDLDGGLISKYIEDRRAEGELTHFRIAIMGRGRQHDDLGDIDLGLGDPVGCINRARLTSVGRGYADIKALMSRRDRVIDLDVSSGEVQAMTMGQLASARNLPQDGGRGDGSGLMLIYPISRNSTPKQSTAKTREPLDAVAHMVGVGIVFPESRSRQAQVDYVTADVAAMQVEVEQPDEDDDLEEDEVIA